MKRVLITGGQGGLAQAFQNKYKRRFLFYCPTRNEMDVTLQSSVEDYMLNKNIDILINNAGSIHPKRILETDSALWINDINVNLIGTFLSSKSVLSNNAKAIIVNISSTAGYNDYPDWSSYCASKSAVITLTKCLANDGFNVFCICPGGFDTKFRSYFELNNDNLMSADHVASLVLSVIEGNYNSGDILFARKGEFSINP
jgi:3-oxoacyl-[acyl-carrier protein] reductase